MKRSKNQSSDFMAQVPAMPVPAPARELHPIASYAKSTLFDPPRLPVVPDTKALVR